MLYVFLVDTGTMLAFEMNLAMQRVRDLQDEIASQYHIPQDKQVLLISGGDSLNPSQRVCSYAAGTDTNPIFLFNKQSLEMSSPPPASTEYGSALPLRGRVEESMQLKPSYETLASRACLAENFYEVAKEEVTVCKQLVHDQHLQHQGWLAVIANLEDVTRDFKANSKVFFRKFEEFLAEREVHLNLLERFPSVIELLSKIPLLQNLETFSLASVSTSEVYGRPKTLLEWIAAQETNKTLEHMMQECHSYLDRFDEHTNTTLVQETETILGQVHNDVMKEVRGLEQRLSQLELFMQAAAKLTAEQEQISKSILNNQANALHIQDPSVLPELCEIHRHQIPQLLKNHEQLQDIKAKCCSAKIDLSENLHKRLRWVMYVEKGLGEMNNRILSYRETLSRLKHRLEIIRQISSSPDTYCRSVVEVVRRKQFSREFTSFAKSLSEKCSDLHHRELVRRRDFDRFFQHHFLKALFPGLEDIPPSFATKCPDPFDDRLPSLTEEDISLLVNQVPELSESLSASDRTALSLSDLLSVRTCDLVPEVKSVSDKQKLLGVEEEEEEEEEEPSSTAALDVSSQSVEIITKEESQLVAMETYEGGPTLALPSNAVAPSGHEGSRSRNASVEVSPEMDDNPANDTFMTADFYIDESLPSSMTELASSKKLAELQGILQDKTAQLEMKEREVLDGKRCISELNAKLLLYERTTKLMNEAVLSCCVPLKKDLEDVKTSVVINRSQSLAELSTVHSNLAELVKTWNVASEQIALDSQMAMAKTFDVSLSAVKEKLDTETQMLQSCVDENEKLRASLNEKSNECERLGVELEKAKDEIDGSKKLLLELELENEKLRTDYKTESEKKDDLIQSLQMTADETFNTVKAKEDALEEMTKKVEMEKQQLEYLFRQDQIENEAKIKEELTSDLIKKHQQDIEEVRKDFERRLDEEKELVTRLTADCANYEKRLEELAKEGELRLGELQKGHEMQCTELKVQKEAIEIELIGAKNQVETLNSEIKMHLECIDDLNQLIKIKSEIATVEAEMQTEDKVEKVFVDGESQAEVAVNDFETQTKIEAVTGDVCIQTEVEPLVTMDVEIQTETQPLITADVEIQAESEPLATADVEIQTECEPSVTADAAIQAESEPLVDVEIQAESEPLDTANVEVQVEREPLATTDVEIQVESEPLVMSNVETQAGCEPPEKVMTTDVENQTDYALLQEAGIQTEFSGNDPAISGVFQTESVPLSNPETLENSKSTGEALDLRESDQLRLDDRGICTGTDVFQTGVCDLHSSSDDLPVVSLPPAQSGELLPLPLRVDDYIPLERHEEMLKTLRTKMEEEKMAATVAAIEEQRQINDDLMKDLLMKHSTEKQQLRADLEADRQIRFNEALNRALSERDQEIDKLQRKIDELAVAGGGKSEASGDSFAVSTTSQGISSSRYVQGKLEDELAEVKQENLRLQSQLRYYASISASQMSASSSTMGGSFMMQSHVASSCHERRPPHTQKDMEKLKQKLIQLSITSSVSDVIMQYVTIYKCREHDILLFVWNNELGHYLAYMADENLQQYFLHSESAIAFEKVSSEFTESRKWLVGEMVTQEVCLAKKANNRFKVPVGTKFNRVKAKPWNPSSPRSQRLLGYEEQSQEKKDQSSSEKTLSKDKS